MLRFLYNRSMTVKTWVFEAIDSVGKDGATVRDIQRHLDEHRFEELALDTIEAALELLIEEDRVEQSGTRYRIKGRTSKEDALRKLFGG